MALFSRSDDVEWISALRSFCSMCKDGSRNAVLEGFFTSDK